MPDPAVSTLFGVPGWVFLGLAAALALSLFWIKAQDFVTLLVEARSEYRGDQFLRRIKVFTANVLGQKRLLEFARIAAAEARLIILDEPMGGVNPVLGARIGEAVGHFAGEGRSVIVVEHNLPFIERTCHQVVVMDLGEVIAQGPFSGLRDNPRVVDAYLGMDQSHG